MTIMQFCHFVKEEEEMIRLEVEDYCQNCPDFEAKVDSTSLHANDKEVVNYHIIRCKHARRCERMKEYLEGQK